MWLANENIGDNTLLVKYLTQLNNKGNLKMATAKKTAPKAAANPKKVMAPAKVVKPVAKAAAKKAPVSKTAKAIAKFSASIAKLTERKDKINAEIQVLRDQRAALKVAPVVPAPVAPKAKAAPKGVAPKKAVKKAVKPAARK
ncbi:MAG: histone protein [Polaromonas sp.]